MCLVSSGAQSMDAPPGKQQRTERTRAYRDLLEQRRSDRLELVRWTVHDLRDVVLHVIPFDDESDVVRARLCRFVDVRPFLIRHDLTNQQPMCREVCENARRLIFAEIRACSVNG